MAALRDLVELFSEAERPVGNILAPEAILAQAVAATRMYAGYGRLSATLPSGATPGAPVTGIIEVSESEWAVIRPLFMLYVERENAMALEASRGLGVDVFGRDSSTIGADITQLEAELPRRAFCREIVTV